MKKKSLLMLAGVFLLFAACSHKAENEIDSLIKAEIGVGSDGWTSENHGEINTETYLSYKKIWEISRTDFIPGAMAQKGDLLYVVNTKEKPSKPGESISPTNPSYYSIEVFNLKSATKLFFYNPNA